MTYVANIIEFIRTTSSWNFRSVPFILFFFILFIHRSKRGPLVEHISKRVKLLLCRWVHFVGRNNDPDFCQGKLYFHMHKPLHLAHSVVVLQTIVHTTGYVGTPAEPTDAAYASYVT